MKELEKFIDFDSDAKKNYEKYSRIRGQQLYLFIGKYFFEINNERINYCYVRDLIRYDKRLKDKLYIYLGTFEDWLKTLIYQQTNYSIDSGFYKSDEINHSSFMEINRIKPKISYDLSKLIKIIENNKIQGLEIISDFNAIRVFRNKVMHHNFLLLKYNDENEIESRTDWLKENLLLLKKYLPKDYQTGFLKDINNCKNKFKLEKIFMEDL